MEQTILNWAFGTVMALIGFLTRTLWDANKELRADLSKLREELPEKYTLKLDIEKRFDKLDEALARIYEKLESKQDKQGH